METRSDRISGEVYPATKEGFVAFIRDANRKRDQGMKLVTVVRLDRALTAVYERIEATGNLVDL